MSEPANAKLAVPLLRATDLAKTYFTGEQPLEVLHGVGIEVGAGDFVALRGVSGAGKSTLLHLLGGLDAPTAGEVWFEGQPLSAMSAVALARFRNTHVGFIFQAYHLLPDLDAVENVALPARMARVPFDEAEKRAVDLLKHVGLGARLGHRPSQLSGGEQQRVAIARALINRPRLLLADEPTGNLDSHTGEEIIRLLAGLREERGVTLVIATHDARVAAHAQRVVELEDGRLK
ncbi:MAG: ABC transporter ATP-binding protein [Pedosphaera sp.]|nr:ABC transporter ATP-binding protein [Pedosphaera sp.]MSS99792.1 ABC transporter ATP-binding protein [Pedosphaera sp.]